MTIVEVAASQLHVREVTRNRSPEIDKYWASTTYDDGYSYREPYCAAFVAWCADQAGRQHPRSASVREWLNWAIENKKVVTKSQAGDIVVFLPKFSHIGVVESVSGKLINTIEGNTSPDVKPGDPRDRDGDGVFRKARALSLCGCFIRL